MIIQRYINLKSKYNNSVFENINRNALGTDTLMLGSTINATNKICSNGDEMKILMPTIVGISSSTPEFTKTVFDYFNNFFLEVPFNPNQKVNKLSLRLDVSYNFNLIDSEKKEVIDAYIKKLPKRDEQYDMEQHVSMCINGTLFGGQYKIKEEDLYKYVTFINIEDYIKYRYCLLHNRVANSVNDINKSVNIQFYLSNEEDEQRIKEAQTKIKDEALKYYIDLISGDINDLDAVLINAEVLNNYQNFKNLSITDKHSLLQDLVTTNPSKLLYYKKDKSLNEKAMIRKFVWFGFIKYIAGTQTLVDSTNATVVIGNNFDEAVSFFANEVNAPYKSELIARYKSLALK